jgi:hypothetical protein
VRRTQDAAMSANVPAKSPVALPQATRKPRRWRRRIGVLAVALVVGTWFAPTIAAHTGLPNRIAREALVDLRGTVEVGGASLGWFKPVELRNVVVKDAQGRTLLTAPKITSSKSLLALLRDRSDLGEFTLDQPTVEVVCEKGLTNLEDALANFLKDEAAPSPSRVAVVTHISGGSLVLREGEREWRFESIDATATVPAARTEPIALKLAASPGKLEADLSLGDTASLRLKADGFPLDSLAPILKRVDPGADVAGRLAADLTVTSAKDTATAEGTASVRDFELAGPWLHGDRLRLASADLPLKAEVAGRLVRIDRADLMCDVGRLSAAGSFDPDEPFDKLLDRPGVKLDADVDLAKLAALLPRLLRVREGTAIREGKLVAKLASRTTPTGTVWDGEVRTSALKAERGGRVIEWAEPLAVEFSGRVPSGHLPTFDKFVCRSDFLAVNAQGSPESFRAAANVYLDRLSARLGEFVDLGGTRLAGEASAWVVASRSPQGAFQADAGAELKRFAFADGGHHGLTEPALTLKASVAGKWPHGGAMSLDTGSVGLTAGGDRLDLKLLVPVAEVKQFSDARLSLNMAGDLARWIARARGFVPIPPRYVFGGTATARGTARILPDAIKIDGLLVGIDKARFRGAGLDIGVPYMNASADLAVSRATGSAEFANLQITSLGLNITEGKLAIELPANAPTAVSGSGKAATDLERLGRALQLQSDPRGSDALQGRGTGPIRFRWQGDTTTFGGTLDIKDFAYGDPKLTGIAEPALRLELDGRYDETPDRIAFNTARVERPGLAVEAKGAIDRFNTTQDAALTGTVTYDLARLTPEVRDALGGGFQAAGHGSRPFALSGRLSPGGVSPNRFAKLTADAGLGWESIKAYGFDVGPGELTVKLANGQATVSPIRATFGGGQVAVTPSLKLAPEPVELSLARGKVVDRAKLTPAACAGALGYALPVIANAAQAEGEISAVLDDNRIPLADLTKATLKGQLVVHKAAVGPGPVVTEIARLLGAASTTMTLANEMAVPVRVEGGRVYHENLSVTVNGYAIKTAGSVGFDGSLALVADVPIPGTFPGFKNNPALKKALEGKVVKVPVGGTMAKPAVDPRLFQAAVATLARDAVKGAGRDLLHKELEKLFPGMPAPKR